MAKAQADKLSAEMFAHKKELIASLEKLSHAALDQVRAVRKAKYATGLSDELADRAEKEFHHDNEAIRQLKYTADAAINLLYTEYVRQTFKL